MNNKYVNVNYLKLKKSDETGYISNLYHHIILYVQNSFVNTRLEYIRYDNEYLHCENIKNTCQNIKIKLN